jgi:hypothetical protein
LSRSTRSIQNILPNNIRLATADKSIVVPEQIYSRIITWYSNLTSEYIPKMTARKVSKMYLCTHDVVAIFTIAITWKHIRCPSMSKWINKMWDNITECYLLLRERNSDIGYKIDNLEDIMLSDKNYFHNKTLQNTMKRRYFKNQNLR